MLAVPSIFYIAWLLITFLSPIDQSLSNQQAIAERIKGTYPIILIFAVSILTVFFSWAYSVATGLNKKLKPEVASKTSFLKICIFLIAVTYGVLFYSFGKIFNIFINNPITDTLPDEFFQIFVTGFVCMPVIFVCFIYIMGFVARAIVSSEMGRKAQVSEYITEFLLIYFFPIGIWFLQPRINKIVGGDNE